MQEWAEKFYKGKKWQKARAYVWSRDKGLCQRCLSKGIIKPGDTVHHLEELTINNINDPYVALNPANLTTLCRDCHAAVHKREKRYIIDELGRVIIREDSPPVSPRI